MSGWPILSVVTFLPLVGALILLHPRRGDEAARNARWIALWTTLVTFVLSLLIWADFDRPTPASSSSRRSLARRHFGYQHGRRRHLDAVRDADRPS
jgi:NADH:ubiquinone oxidoreductase subunit 4 (subunit M)